MSPGWLPSASRASCSAQPAWCSSREHRAGADPAAWRACPSTLSTAPLRDAVGQGEHAERHLGVEPPYRPDVEHRERRLRARDRVVTRFRLRRDHEEGAVERQPQGVGHLPQGALRRAAGEDHLDQGGPLALPRAQDLPGLVAVRGERGVAVGVLHREDRPRQVDDVVGGHAGQAARGGDQRRPQLRDADPVRGEHLRERHALGRPGPAGGVRGAEVGRARSRSGCRGCSPTLARTDARRSSGATTSWAA